MSLTKSTFAIVSQAFRIPSSYLYLRANANASGAHMKYCQYDSFGKVIQIALVIRVPHAPQNEFKSIWSTSLSWDLQRNSTDIYSDGFTQPDLHELETWTSKTDALFQHPFAFPVFMVELLNVYYNKMAQTLGDEVAVLEKKLGITRGNKGFHGWGWQTEVFRTYTQECYRLTASPVYLERRLVFLTSLCHFLLECLDALEREVADDVPARNQIMSGSAVLAHTLRNNLQLANGQLHQTRCLGKRLDNLISTLNAIVAQVDSRSNLEIAAAAKHDSSSMLAIAFLTALFLPPTYVCSMFGMNFFDFEGEAARHYISPLFWLYWAVTIPLTTVVLTTWRIWGSWRDRSIAKLPTS